MPARQLVSIRFACLVGGAALLAFAGCSSTAATPVPVTHPTMIEVSPDDFLGDVPCSSGGSGLKRYVATLIDTNQTFGGIGGEGGAGSTAGPESAAGDDAGQTLTAGGAPDWFKLPSSLPTPCLAAVGFGFVVATHNYHVKIDGYDRDDLAPRASGARQMVSPAPTEAQPLTPLIAPRWTAHCERAIAVDSTIVRADHCTPFSAAEDATTGDLRVQLGPLLGDLECGSKPGEVEQLSVSVDLGSGEQQSQSVACSPTAEALFSDLPARRHVSVYIAAQSADAAQPLLAGATCDANTLPGASVDAACSSLSSLGTLRVDLQTALQQLSLSCTAADVTDVEVRVVGTKEAPRSFGPPACLQPFDHGFSAGTQSVVVEARRGETVLGSLSCHGDVAPGKLVTATCEQDPAE